MMQSGNPSPTPGDLKKATQLPIPKLSALQEVSETQCDTHVKYMYTSDEAKLVCTFSLTNIMDVLVPMCMCKCTCTCTCTCTNMQCTVHVYHIGLVDSTCISRDGPDMPIYVIQHKTQPR